MVGLKNCVEYTIDGRVNKKLMICGKLSDIVLISRIDHTLPSSSNPSSPIEALLNSPNREEVICADQAPVPPPAHKADNQKAVISSWNYSDVVRGGKSAVSTSSSLADLQSAVVNGVCAQPAAETQWNINAKEFVPRRSTSTAPATLTFPSSVDDSQRQEEAFGSEGLDQDPATAAALNIVAAATAAVISAIYQNVAVFSQSLTGESAAGELPVDGGESDKENCQTGMREEACVDGGEVKDRPEEHLDSADWSNLDLNRLVYDTLINYHQQLQMAALLSQVGQPVDLGVLLSGESASSTEESKPLTTDQSADRIPEDVHNMPGPTASEESGADINMSSTNPQDSPVESGIVDISQPPFYALPILNPLFINPITSAFIASFYTDPHMQNLQPPHSSDVPLSIFDANSISTASMFTPTSIVTPSPAVDLSTVPAHLQMDSLNEAMSMLYMQSQMQMNPAPYFYPPGSYAHMMEVNPVDQRDSSQSALTEIS